MTNIHLHISGCKQIATFTAANQFYSYVVLCACSDRTLRLIDLNTQRVTSQISDCHTRPVHKIIQAQYHCGPMVTDVLLWPQLSNNSDERERPPIPSLDTSMTAANSLYNILQFVNRISAYQSILPEKCRIYYESN